MKPTLMPIATSLAVFSLCVGGTAIAEVIYCQDVDQLEGCLASMTTPFGGELADDIPFEYNGQVFDQSTIWVGEWIVAEWLDPVGLYFRVWNESCPPGDTPAYGTFIPWSQVTVLDEVSIPFGSGLQICKKITFSHDPVTIGFTTSVGFSFDAFPDDPTRVVGIGRQPTIFGECEAYIYDFFMSGTWNPVSSPGGGLSAPPSDLVFCLESTIVPTEDMTWGTVKALFK